MSMSAEKCCADNTSQRQRSRGIGIYYQLKFYVAVQQYRGLAGFPGEHDLMRLGLTPPLCPSCCEPMRLARTTPHARLPDLQTFECRPWGVAFVEADEG